jgi:putative ATP-binding cassette transporter
MNRNAEPAAVNDAVHERFVSRIWHFITPYWRSEERKIAWVLLLSVIGLSLLSVAISVWFNSWNRDFYNALEHKDYAAFVQLILHFSAIAALAIVASVFRTYLTQMLTIRWRRWLTEMHFSRWLQHRNYYQLEQRGDTDNPDQRMAEDLNSFTTDTLSLGLGFIRNLVSLVSFSVILWGVSGSLEVFGVTIPGYMFWAALLYSVLGSWITHLIGRRLIGLSNQQQRFEADMRFSLVRVRENAESIALFRGEATEKQRLSQRFARVWGNYWQIMRVQKRMSFFTSGYSQIAIVFPFVVAAPRYFSGKLDLGTLMQISQAFGNVQESMSWFIDAYINLAVWRATGDRLLSFNAAMEANEQRTGGIELIQQGAALQVAGLTLRAGLAADSRVLLQGADLHIGSGEHVLVGGRSGSGKSTLLRALGQLSPAGDGQVRLPESASLFLPQQPYLPIGPLREALSYPQPADSYSPQRYQEVLHACRLDHLQEQLDRSEHWQRMLSPGEQQRLAFARALLNAPRWLYLDEATSAMDEEDEAAMYQAVLERLPGVTLISVGHRSSLKAFHSRQLRVEQGQLVERPPTAASL